MGPGQAQGPFRLQNSSIELVALLCKTEEKGLRGDPVWVRVALPQRVRGSAVGRGAVGKKSVRSSHLAEMLFYANPGVAQIAFIRSN